MESFTKSKLTEEQLRRLAEAVFGEDRPLAEAEELTGGYFNAAYRLKLKGGEEAILKVAPADDTETMSYERGIMTTEVEALQLAGKLGLAPVPVVYAHDVSRTVLPYDYFVMEKVKGQPYNEIRDRMTAQERSAIEEQLGRYNRRINELKGESFGLFNPPDGSRFRTWREAFSRLIGDVLDDAVRLGAQMPVDTGLIRRGIDELLPALDEVREPRLVHWDLWEGNVFVDEGRITALIDWERALWGDPLMEFHFRYIAEHQLRVVEQCDAFYRGYGSFCDSPDEKRRKKLYDLYLDLIYFVECSSRKYTSQDHLDWAHNQLLEGWERFSSGGIRS